MAACRIGDFEIHALCELEIPAFDALDLFPTADAAMLDDARAVLGPGFIDDAGKLIMAFRSFVLKTPRHTILIDTCLGNDKQRPGRPQFSGLKTSYLADLSALGVAPDEVDFVMCTHLHWDHVGWNTRLVDGRWVPTFPNARYVMAKREFEFWDEAYRSDASSRHAASFADSVDPIARAGRALLVADDFELERGVWLEPCAGHTVGNVVINVASGDGRGAFAGDVLQHPLQLLQPELSSRPDFDQALSRSTRRAFIEQHADTGNIVMPTHFPGLAAGRIVRKAASYRFVA